MSAQNFMAIQKIRQTGIAIPKATYQWSRNTQYCTKNAQDIIISKHRCICIHCFTWVYGLKINLISSSSFFLSEKGTAAHITDSWIINRARYRLHHQSMKMKRTSFYRQLAYLVSKQWEQQWVLLTSHGLLFWKLMSREILESISVKWKKANVVYNNVSTWYTFEKSMAIIEHADVIRD